MTETVKRETTDKGGLLYLETHMEMTMISYITVYHEAMYLEASQSGERLSRNGVSRGPSGSPFS